jgi:toxin CptA
MLMMGPGWSPRELPTHDIDGLVLLGGVLLGLGAWLNDACVFGTVARLGKRDLHYLLTPVGFFAGNLMLVRWGWDIQRNPHFAMAAWPHGMIGGALLFASLVVSALAVRRVRKEGLGIGTLWDYRHASIAIGLAYLLIAMVRGPWAYSDALGAMARSGMLESLGSLILFLAVVTGSVLGGHRQAPPVPFERGRAIRCFSGGLLMGIGGSLIPGGNDALVLQGLPWFQPYAVLALAAMMLTIAACLMIEKRLRSCA